MTPNFVVAVDFAGGAGAFYRWFGYFLFLNIYPPIVGIEISPECTAVYM